MCVPCRTQISSLLTHHPLWRGTETSHGPTRQVGIPLSFILEMGDVCLYIAVEARVTQLLATRWQACQPLLQHGAVCSGLLSCKACLGKLAVITSLQPEGRQHAWVGCAACSSVLVPGESGAVPGWGWPQLTVTNSRVLLSHRSSLLGNFAPVFRCWQPFMTRPVSCRVLLPRNMLALFSKYGSPVAACCRNLRALPDWQNKAPLPAVCVTSQPDCCLCRAAALLGNLGACPAGRHPCLPLLAHAAA